MTPDCAPLKLGELGQVTAPLRACYLSLYHDGRWVINLRISKLPPGSRILFMCISVKMGETKEKGIQSKPWCLPPMIPDAILICSGFH